MPGFFVWRSDVLGVVCGVEAVGRRLPGSAKPRACTALWLVPLAGSIYATGSTLPRAAPAGGATATSHSQSKAGRASAETPAASSRMEPGTRADLHLEAIARRNPFILNTLQHIRSNSQHQQQAAAPRTPAPMMDLTSLSSTLPNNPKRNNYPPAELMAAFKQAALSVTNLYKQANTDVERSRKLGYQDCLDDLLQLISSDRIQLNNEVVKIREWGLSKRRKASNDEENDFRPTADPSAEESEEERTRPQPARSSSPMHADPPAPAQSTPQVRRSPPTMAPMSPEYVSPPRSPASYHHIQPQRAAIKEIDGPFSFRSPTRLPHPATQTPQIPIFEDIDLPDTTSDSLVSTPVPEPPLHHYNNNFMPGSHRAPSGGWKRRLPHDFVALAAMAEREKMPFDYNGNKRGRLT
ncbi:hypothetical protein DFH27DRAFT_605857 [Peziza echinospora]|nr:hypothetical protein DFH27DRAFT_605857 [Peziza echinospora]